MGSFTVRASKTLVAFAVVMTLASGLLGTLLARARHGEGPTGMIATGSLCFAVVGGVFLYCLGSTTRIDERGIRTSWLGMSRPRRSCPWCEVHGIAVLPSDVGRASVAVKVARTDGRVFELRAPIATNAPASEWLGRQFDKDAQAIIAYCHRAVPRSEAVTAEEIAHMARDYEKTRRISRSTPSKG